MNDEIVIYPLADQSNESVAMDNYILDYIMPQVKPNAWKILCLIIREIGGEFYSVAAQLSFDQIRQRTGISSDETINNSIKQLISKKYISAQRYEVDPHEAAAKVQAKTPQYIESGVVCDWCSGLTLRLHSHHFPVPAKDKGKETVRICANCHDEYHYLVDKTSYWLGESLITQERQNDER